MPTTDVRTRLLEGAVIPAHPLALTAQRELNEQRQRALSRYYLDAGAGGLAVGVHTTQFLIHDNGMLQPVWEWAMDEMVQYEQRTGRRPLKIAGLIGDTPQAVAEAHFARQLGYEAGLLSLAALKNADNERLMAHCRQVADEIPIIGFYLQPAVGGRVLDYDFWRAFFTIENVVAVKVAPFDQYKTVDVLRALADSGRHDDIALYTGNDDHIVLDLIGGATFGNGQDDTSSVGFVGGLLGQWACFTHTVVQQFEQLKALRQSGDPVPQHVFTLARQMTDLNAALFDVRNNYKGVIAGIHEALRRQGLLEGIWCLDPTESLGPGQRAEIDRVWAAYPHLRDDAFVEENIHRWLTP